MNVLLVDDQKAVVDSLKNGVRWDTIPVERVYTACSAMEAKLVLTNFPVNVLLTDIEMPEEDGISLCRWTRAHYEDVECIFLTSHAEFEYAKEAIRLGNFDYILQPVRYEDVENVLRKVREKIRAQEKQQRMMDERWTVIDQRNVIMEAVLSKISREKDAEADQIYSHFREMLAAEYEDCMLCPMLAQVLKWKKITDVWDEKLVSLVLCNVMEEMFEQEQGKCSINMEGNRYWMVLIVRREGLSEEILNAKLNTFCDFINRNMDFSIALYLSESGSGGGEISAAVRRLVRKAGQNTEKKKGVFREETRESAALPEENPVEAALWYIRSNLNKNFSRKDVAEHVHLNEEYFSRLFHQQTGSTFKEVVLAEKMNEAKKLLAGSRLSVGIIASKVGYDNFSYFSKLFKKMTGQTPQEYRKEQQGG